MFSPLTYNDTLSKTLGDLQGFVPPTMDQPTIPEVMPPDLPIETRSPFASLGPMTNLENIPDLSNPAQVPQKSLSIQDIISRSLERGPEYTPYPEPPKPSVGGAMKLWGKSMIPGYGAMMAMRRQWENQNVTMQNAEAEKRYQQAIEIAKPLMTRQFDLEADQEKLEQRAQVLMRAGVPRTEAYIRAGGGTPQVPRALPAASPVHIVLPDKSEVDGYARDDEHGVRRIYTNDGNAIPPLVAGQSKIFSQKAEPTEPRDRTFDVEQQYAQAIQDAAQGKPVRPEILSAAQAHVAYKKSMQPPPSYQILPAEGGYAAVNPKAPGASPVAIPGMGGAAQLQPQAKPLDAATKAKVNQAWVINQTGEKIKQTMQKPAVLREIGVLAGRKAEDWDRAIGTMSPEARGLYANLASFYSLQGFLHGWRAIRVKDEFQKAIGGMAQDPKTLIAGIEAMQELSKTFMELGKNQGYSPGPDVTGDPFAGVSNGELLTRAKGGDQAARAEYIRRYESQGKK